MDDNGPEDAILKVFLGPHTLAEVFDDFWFVFACNSCIESLALNDSSSHSSIPFSSVPLFSSTMV